MKDFNVGILTAAHKSIPRGARQIYSHTGVKSWKDWMRNYLQPEGKLKPTNHKTITIPYNILRPDFSDTSYKPGGKAGETKQHHSTWRKMDTDKAT